jgi:hypothetical protein
MQQQTTWNLLVWDSPESIPFPEEVKPLLSKIKWDTYEWHTCNLPINYAKYSVSGGKDLYLNELPNGQIKIEKQEFTGEIPLVSYFINEDRDGYNYFVAFTVKFYNGEVKEILLDTIQKQLTKEYEDVVRQLNVSVARAQKRTNSFWYKWLYRPYAYSVRGIAFIPLIVLNFLRYLIIKTVRILTPL